jgi:uncharacterized protein (TIGR00730 family)
MTRIFFKEEQGFFSGRQSRLKELKYAIGVVFQFVKGFRTLHFVGPCITVFGSARFKEDHPYYELARKVSEKVSRLGFTIMTGGGPGIMEAANRGARDAGGPSVGCNIILPHEQYTNPYLDKFINIEYFFVRKELLRKYSFAFIVMPGGFGTLDEFFETLTLIQTKKTAPFPIVIMGIDFYKDLRKHIHTMAEQNTISNEDIELILFTDDVDEAVEHIHQYAKSTFEIKKKTKKHKPFWFLGESH